MLGKGRQNNISNRLLAFHIGLRDRRSILLGTYFQVATEVLATYVGRLLCRVERNFKFSRWLPQQFAPTVRKETHYRLCAKTIQAFLDSTAPRTYRRDKRAAAVSHSEIENADEQCSVDLRKLLTNQIAAVNDPNRTSTWAIDMGNRLSKIYTRTGDNGTTGLGDGSRIDKDALRVEAYGTVDEANSLIGVILCAGTLPESVAACLTDVQHDLFELGGELCIPGHASITPQYVERLEASLDDLNQDLPPLKEFILPGGGPAAAACHVARTVVRRAERRVVTLMREETVREELVRYLNRLSDLLFVVARVVARIESGSETLWNRDR